MNSPQHSLAQLPCTNLRVLDLQGGVLRLPMLAADAYTSLTSLALTQDMPRSYRASQKLISEVRRCTNLHRLELCMYEYRVDSTRLWEALQDLPVLTHLSLRHIEFVMQGSGERLSRMTKLQALILHDPSNHQDQSGQRPLESEVTALQHLQHLTQLSLDGTSFNLEQDPASIAGLTHLRSLKLARCTVEVAALSKLTALASCSLQSVTWTPSSMGMFQWLARMQGLTYLSLGGLASDNFTSLTEAAPSKAITASRRLEHLDLSQQHLYPYECKPLFSTYAGLPELQRLELPNMEHVRLEDRHPMAHQVIPHLAVCCPALNTLQGGWGFRAHKEASKLTALIRLEAQQGETGAAAAGVGRLQDLKELRLYTSNCRKTWRPHDFQALLKLGHLTSLELRSIHPQGPTALHSDAPAALVQLTCLARLDLQGARLHEWQLAQLAALTRLTYLRLHTEDFGPLLLDRLQSLGGRRVESTITLQSKVYPVTQASVAYQLQECFNTDYRQMQATIDSLQQLAAHQQQQLLHLSQLLQQQEAQQGPTQQQQQTLQEPTQQLPQ